MNRGLSTLTEILVRGKIWKIFPSSLRSDTFIIIFELGDQANIDGETLKQLNIENI